MFKKEEGEFNRKKFLLSLLAVVLTLLIALLFYYFFIKPVQCYDADCYKQSLLRCKRATFIHEDNEAVWTYTIRSPVTSESCRVDVTLLYFKEGNVAVESLQGESMTCTVLKSSATYPEKDIGRCTGQLKEHIQDIIIQRMHNYLLSNIGKIDQEFAAV